MKATINDVAMGYDDQGSGPAVVLIHGFPLCRRMWLPQVKALVDAGYRVIVPDLRGFGESASPDGPYSMSLFADDVVGLLDHLGLDKAIVGGMSMGGYVLLNLLERHQERVTAALFLVTRAGGDDDTGRARRTKLAQAVGDDGPHVVTDFFGEILFAPRTAESRPELVAQVRGWMEGTSKRGLQGGLLAIRDRKDFLPDLPLLDVPALVVGAEEDKAVPPQDARHMAELLPKASFRSIPDAGHMANLEHPDIFNRIVIEFLDGLGLKR